MSNGSDREELEVRRRKRAGSPDQSRQEAKPNRTWLYVGLGVGAGVFMLSFCCCGGIGAWYWLGDRDGVSSVEKREIQRHLDMNREAGRENEPVFLFWGGMELADTSGQKVKLIRVKFHQRKSPNMVLDRLFWLAGGKYEASIPNRFGEDWKTKAPTLDRDKVRKGLF